MIPNPRALSEKSSPPPNRPKALNANSFAFLRVSSWASLKTKAEWRRPDSIRDLRSGARIWQGGCRGFSTAFGGQLPQTLDDLERINELFDFEMLRPDLEAAVPRADRSKGGRPPFDCVFMFQVLIPQTMHARARGTWRNLSVGGRYF
jgi:hypothetical protein